MNLLLPYSLRQHGYVCKLLNHRVSQLHQYPYCTESARHVNHGCATATQPPFVHTLDVVLVYAYCVN